MGFFEPIQKIYFSGGSFTVELSRDFFHNSISGEPFTHTHPKYEFHYTRKGSIRFVSPQKELVCPEGSVLIIPPRLPHVIYPAEADAATDSFLFAADRGYVADAVSRSLCTDSVMLVRDTANANERLARIQEQLKNGGTVGIDMIRGELILLFAELAAAVSDFETVGSGTSRTNRTDVIEAYLSENYCSPTCSCDELAGLMGLSSRQVHRLCVAYYGQPFRDILYRMRMEIAEYKLRRERISVTELSELLGYSSPAAFSSAYKRYFGHPPTAGI